MNNENIIEKVENPETTQKEPVKKYTNQELNNNLVLDTIIKITKALQFCNMILDINNTQDLDIVISPEEYQTLQNDVMTLLNNLSGQFTKFNQKYLEVINGVKPSEPSENPDVPEPQDY